MKKNIPKKQIPATSPTKKLVTRRFQKARPELRRYLGLEAENAIDELSESFLDFIEEVGSAARDKAIVDAINAIPNTGRELVERLMRLRDRKEKAGSSRKEVHAAKANKGGADHE